jgi:CRP/FNR family transcriptional regulator
MSERGFSTNIVSVFSDPQTQGITIEASGGDVIFHHDAAADRVYCIQRGQVRLYSVASDESSRLIAILGAGDWFGAAALAGAATYQMRAVSVGASTLIETQVARLLAVLAGQPDHLIELTRQLAVKLLAGTEDANRFVFEDCNQRLIGALLRFSKSAASTPHEDGVVLNITHDQLAQAVGVARETVSLALTQLRQQNLLRTGRNQLIFNPQMLQQFSDRYSAGQARMLAPADSSAGQLS